MLLSQGTIIQMCIGILKREKISEVDIDFEDERWMEKLYDKIKEDWELKKHPDFKNLRSSCEL